MVEKSHGVQDKKDNKQDKKDNKQDEEFPQTWEELCEKEVWFEKIPQLEAPELLTYKQSARFTVIATKARLAFSQGLDPKQDPITAAEQMGEVTGELITFFEELTDMPEQFEQATVGMDSTMLFYVLLSLVRFYEEQLGKSSMSKMSSTSIR